MQLRSPRNSCPLCTSAALPDSVCDPVDTTGVAISLQGMDLDELTAEERATLGAIRERKQRCRVKPRLVSEHYCLQHVVHRVDLQPCRAVQNV